eukprot:1112825-Amphidinium_carterae.1
MFLLGVYSWKAKGPDTQEQQFFFSTREQIPYRTATGQGITKGVRRVPREVARRGMPGCQSPLSSPKIKRF